MIEKFPSLQKVKVSREESALGTLRASRTRLAEAMQHRGECKAAVDDSAATLTGRENAIFDTIIQAVVGTDEVDLVKESVLLLHKGHQELEDELEMADQQCLQLSQEVEEARRAYQSAQRTREKFDRMLRDLVEQQAGLDERTEEAEIEELFGRERHKQA